MTPPVYTHRLRWLGLTLTLGYVALACWVGHFQTLKRAEYVQYRAANHGARHPLPARRGAIKDVHGAVLAVSAPVRTVCVDPGIAADLPEAFEPCRLLVAAKVAEVLGMDDVAAVYGKFQPRWIQRGDKRILDRYELLQRDVPLETWRRLTNELARLPFPFNEEKNPKIKMLLRALRHRAVFSEPSYRRLYPSGRLAPHVVGLVRVQETNQLYGVWRWEEGVMGIERQFDHRLRGAPGYQVGRERLLPVDGANVVLTLDVGAQRIVRTALVELVREHKAEGAVAVVLRPRTGDVVAMVSLPDFDPEDVRDVNTLRNWAVAAQIEPGSTFKAVTFAAALERVRRLPWDEKVDCENGVWWLVRGRHSDRIRDFHPYRELTWLDVLRKSSNIGTGKLAERFVPPDFFHAVCEALGFNEAPQLYLPEVVRGNVPRPERRTTYLRMVFGQSVAVTPLHMALAYATIANGGVLMRPRLVARVEDDEGRVLLENPPSVVRRVFSPATATNLTWALTQVVSPGGTGRRVESRLYTIAGKTGTAQWYDPDYPNPYTKDGKGGYPPGADYPSFVGFFPATQPELCMLIGLIKPHSPGRHGGGSVVGPTWKRVAEQLGNYLRIRPDRAAPPEWLPEPADGPWPEAPLAINPSRELPEEVYW